MNDLLMILYFLLISLLPLGASKVELENTKKGAVNDELKYKSSWQLLTHEEAAKSDEIIKSRKAKVYTIEVLVMLDYSIYAWWLNLNKGDPKKASKELNIFYANIFQKIKMRYNRVKINGVQYDLQVVNILIAKSKNDVPFVEKEKVSENSVNIDTVLRNLTTWLKANRKHLERHDLFALFTKYDTGIFNGLAWPGTTCTDHGVSVTRELGFFDTYHSACHEIGHNLGSHHDDASDCPYDSQYIMAAGTEFITDENFGNRHTFSPCSLRYFKDYIKKINNDSSNCMVIQSAKKHFKLEKVIKAPLGRVFDVDKQCQIFQGPKSFFCAGGSSDFKTMCRQITCWNDTEKICQRSPKSAPADGTACGSGKSCRDETCLNDPSVKSGQDNCFYGDWKGKIEDDYSRNITCKNVREGKTYLCYMKDIADACCETCGQVYKPEKTGCAYGDKTGGCKKSECTYGKVTSCCRTCELNASMPCQFGDKASWCNSLERYECYESEETCCKTCSKLVDKKKKDCRYGDAKAFCKKKIRDLPKLCKQVSYQQDCCESCEFIKTPQCIDWDPAYCNTINNYACYQKDVEETCCKKCKNLKYENAPEGCDYGDKTYGCTVAHCKTEKEQCCYTCLHN